jgi:hypothetical protein
LSLPIYNKPNFTKTENLLDGNIRRVIVDEKDVDVDDVDIECSGGVGSDDKETIWFGSGSAVCNFVSVCGPFASLAAFSFNCLLY